VQDKATIAGAIVVLVLGLVMAIRVELGGIWVRAMVAAAAFAVFAFLLFRVLRHPPD